MHSLGYEKIVKISLSTPQVSEECLIKFLFLNGIFQAPNLMMIVLEDIAALAVTQLPFLLSSDQRVIR